jgi:hypothetical protein
VQPQIVELIGQVENQLFRFFGRRAARSAAWECPSPDGANETVRRERRQQAEGEGWPNAFGVEHALKHVARTWWRI